MASIMSSLFLLLLLAALTNVIAQTCSGYQCTAPKSLRPSPEVIVCPVTGCNGAICCELQLPNSVLSPKSQAFAPDLSQSVPAAIHCTPGKHEFEADSTANHEARKAVKHGLLATQAERQSCGIGPLPLFFDSESFLNGDLDTHFVHVQSKFSSSCKSKSFKLNFHIVGVNASSFSIQINRDLGTGLWKFLSSQPAPCHINTNSVSSPQFVSTDSKFVKEAAEFAAAELTFQQQEQQCLSKDAESTGWKVSKVLEAAARVLTGLEITVRLELQAGRVTKKTAILTVLEQCGKFKQCYYQLRLLKESVCKPFEEAPTVAPSTESGTKAVASTESTSSSTPSHPGSIAIPPAALLGSTAGSSSGSPSASAAISSCNEFSCPAPLHLRSFPEQLHCTNSVTGVCTRDLCCKLGAQAPTPDTVTPTAPPAAPTPIAPTPVAAPTQIAAPTQALTCAGFSCPANMHPRFQSGSLSCDVGGCTSDLCCMANTQAAFMGARRLYDSESTASVLKNDPTDDPTEAWEAQRRWLHDDSPDVQKRRLEGLNRGPLARRHIKAGPVPFSYDPTGHDCYKKLAVYDQGECGSCYAAAVAQMIGIRLCLHKTKANVLGIGRRLEQDEDAIEATSPEDLNSDIKITEEPRPKSMLQESSQEKEHRLQNIGMKAMISSPSRGLKEADKCIAPTGIPYQDTPGCAEGSTIENKKPCVPQCQAGYMAKLSASAKADKHGGSEEKLECNKGMLVPPNGSVNLGEPEFSCVPEKIKIKGGKEVPVVVLRSSMTIWVTKTSLATTTAEILKDLNSKTGLSTLAKALKTELEKTFNPSAPLKVKITITPAERRLADGRRLSDAKLKLEYSVVSAKLDKKKALDAMKSLKDDAVKTAFQTEWGKKLRFDSVKTEKTVMTEANGYGFRLGEEVIWKGSDSDVPEGTIGKVAGYDDKEEEERIVVSFMFPKGKTFSFKPDELQKAEQHGLRIGEQVFWRGFDSDVPKGTVGDIIGFKTGKSVTVQFPKGAWNFRANELKKALVSTPLRSHVLKGHRALKVLDATFFAEGDEVVIGANTKCEEDGVIVRKDGGGLTLKNPMKCDHSPGETVKATTFCSDSSTWAHEGVISGAKGMFTGRYDCKFYANHDPGCTKHKDVGQRTHCRKACHTCPWHSTNTASTKDPWVDAWYEYMPSLNQVAQCSKSADQPSGCNGGGLHNVWNTWMMKMETDLWQMGERCMPYTLKCFASEGVVNPLSSDECEMYSGYELWHKPCSCIPKTVRPKAYTCPSMPPSSDCGVAVPPAMFYVKHMGDGLSNKDAVLNIQRHITEFGPVWLSFEVTTAFINQDWKEDPVYIGEAGSTVTGGHSALAVGWGTLVVNHWILRNSWTENWAEKGYAKFRRGLNLDKIESLNIGVSMPSVTFPDFTAPVCHLHHVETNYKYSGTILDQYMFTPTVRCSEQSKVTLFVSHRLKDRSQMVAGVTGNYYTAEVLAMEDHVFKPIEMAGKGFGLEDGYAWIKMTAADGSDNAGEVNSFVEIPKVEGMTMVAQHRRLFSNATANSMVLV